MSEKSDCSNADKLNRYNEGLLFGGSSVLCEENTTTSGLKRQVQESYKKRLGTFSNPFTFYAKPLDISPLLCARFGFTNSGKNLLKCEGCSAIICADFHPDLSPLSRKKLSRTYREMLANVHSDDCPFKSDAKRCLLHSTSSETRLELKDSTHFVPTYLLSMLDEFKLFEDKSQGGCIVKNFVLKEAQKLTVMMTLLKQRPETNISWKASIPLIVLDKVLRIPSGNYFEVASRRHELEDCVIDKFVAIIQEVENKENNQIMNGNSDRKIFKEAALLSAFGWRLDALPSNCASCMMELEVKCPLCLSCAVVPRTDDPNNGVQQQDYHNVISDTEDQSDEIYERPPSKKSCIRRSDYFDVISSHRHFCPYSSGFAPDHWEPPKDSRNVDLNESQKAGWINVVEALMK